MSKVHYIIESSKKAQIERNENGKIKIVIQDVVRMEKNRKIKVKNGELVSNNENNCSNDWVSVILYGLAFLMMFFLVAILAFGKDLGIWNNNYIDNIIGIVALLFAVSSIPFVKEFLNRKLVLSKLYNKLWYFLMIMCIPFYIVLFMKWVGITFGISNICGIAGVLISVFTWGE